MQKVLRKKQVLALEKFKEDILKLDVLLKENGKILIIFMTQLEIIKNVA